MYFKNAIITKIFHISRANPKDDLCYFSDFTFQKICFQMDFYYICTVCFHKQSEFFGS